MPIAQHVHKHGDGVLRDLAFWVDDARDAYAKAIERGAKSVHEPRVDSDANGEVVIAAIATYGDTIHSIVERRNYRGLFLPGFQPRWRPRSRQNPVGLKYVDHCVGNVELGKMNEWVAFYSRVLGFFNLLSTFDDKQISTEYSSLMSKVMSNGSGRIKISDQRARRPGRKKSQIDEYLDFYGGPGVRQLCAHCYTDDIVKTVRALKSAGSGIPSGAAGVLRHRSRARLARLTKRSRRWRNWSILAC